MKQKIIDRISNTWIDHFISSLINALEYKLMSFYHDKGSMKLLRDIMREDKPLLIKPSELFLIFSMSKNQAGVDGDFAEVGVYKGTSAQAICEAKGKKHIHLFDTFEGLPEIKDVDPKFKKGLYAASYEQVKEKFAKYENVHIYKGIFPETGEPVKNRKFCFVHLDVDLFQSTKDSLEFFYTKVSRGGIIISHDYHAQGVKKAFDDFFADKPEQIIELPMSQCMIIKR